MATAATINYFGGQTIDNSEMVTNKIETKLNGTVGKLTDLSTTAKNSIVNAINELKNAQNTFVKTVDAVLSDTSTNPVQNKAVKAGIAAAVKPVSDLASSNSNRITELEGKIPTSQTIDIALDKNSDHAVQNKTITSAFDNVNKAIDELTSTIDSIQSDIAATDDEPTKGSDNFAKSGGIFNAIRFASAKVGDTMFWPNCYVEERTLRENEQFSFTFRGKSYSVTPKGDRTVKLIISKAAPDGWHELDGKAELNASEQPELAAFLGPNNIINGKIWLPYVQEKIIKVKY